MKKVIIVTDSTCDLTEEIKQNYNIKVIPLYVNFGEDSFLDGYNIKTEELYELVEKKGMLPKTAAPSPQDFVKFFKPFIDDGNDVVYIGLSSKLSSTLQSAKIASEEFPEGRIHIVDSLNLSTGVGLLALKAAKFASEGCSAQIIAEKVRQTVPKIETAFVIDTLDYLYKGGRCSSLANFMSTVLKIKPIIHVINGGMDVGSKPIGRNKAFNIMLNKIYKDKDILDNDIVMVTHSLNHEAAELLKAELRKNLNIKNIFETYAGCVISSHCGKGTIGILYATK